MRKFVLVGVVLVMTAVVLVTVVAAQGNGAGHASAQLVDAAGNEVGFGQFTEDATGLLHVNVHVKGVSAGQHGIHLHAVGSCTPTFAAAGGHHNPLARQHGLHNPGGAHAGDLPNLEVNAAGVGRLVGTTDRATLSAGPTTLFDADGSAIIIHANPDDQLTDPTGNSGGRIVCGVIVQ